MRYTGDLLRDLRFALRQFAKNRIFALTVIVSLGLAIGANTALFTLLNAVVFRRLSVPQPSRIANITLRSTANDQLAFTYAQLKDLREHQPVFSSISGWLEPMLTLEVKGSLSTAAVLVVTQDYYSTYPVRPILGRTLVPADFQPSSGAAVISERLWERRFGADPRVLGRTIRVEGQPFSIVGVIPATFSSPQIDVTADVTIPVEARPTQIFQSGLSSVHLLGSGRMRQGVSLAQANAAMQVLWPSILKDTEPGGLTPSQTADYLSTRVNVDSGARGQSFLRRDFSADIRILMIAVVMLLLLACVNVATLLLARSSARSGEIGVRLALGASRARVLRQLCTESILLALGSAALGLILSIWAGPFLLSLMWNSPVPLTISLRPDLCVLAFAVGVAVLATLLFGLLPGWVTLEESLGAFLHAGARTLVGGRGRWLRRSLVSVEVALAVVLLVGAGLVVRTAHRLATARLGFEPAHVAVFELCPKPGGYQGIDLYAYERELLARVASLPGVASAALSQSAPAWDNNWIESIADAAPQDTKYSRAKAQIQFVSFNFFRTFGVRILSGREFSPQDQTNSRRVVVIGQDLADRLFPDGRAIGRYVNIGDASASGDQAAGTSVEVVGIVADSRLGDLHRRYAFAAYLPFFQLRDSKFLEWPVLEVRAEGSPLAIMPSVESQVSSLGHEFVFWAQTMPQAMDANLSQERLLASLSTFFALVAGLLAVIGLFGLLSYSVSRRIREFGVRMALGAQSQNVFFSVFKEALILVMAGLMIGLPIAMAAARLLASRVTGLQAADTTPFVVAVGLLAAAGVLAAWAPARRASRVNPMDALRQD